MNNSIIKLILKIILVLEKGVTAIWCFSTRATLSRLLLGDLRIMTPWYTLKLTVFSS